MKNINESSLNEDSKKTKHKISCIKNRQLTKIKQFFNKLSKDASKNASVEVQFDLLKKEKNVIIKSVNKNIIHTKILSTMSIQLQYTATYSLSGL